MLNKSQWKSVWFLSTITSVLLSIIIFRNSYITNEDAFISIIYAIIPIIVIIGTTYTLYLKGNNPINVLPVFKKINKWILKMLTIAIVSFAVGFGLKVPIELGTIIYNKYSFNENILKTKFAKDRTWGSDWGIKYMEITNTSLEYSIYETNKVSFKGNVYNKTGFPLTCVYLRMIAINKIKKDTLYDNVIGIDSYFSPKSVKNVIWDLPDAFFELYLLNTIFDKKENIPNDSDNKKNYTDYYNMRVEFHPYGGKIATEYIEKISRSNLKSLIED